MSKTSHDEIADAILEMVESNSGTEKEITSKVASYLIDERRTRDLNSIFRLLELKRYEKSGKLEAEVTSAYEISDIIKDEITNKFDAKQVLLDMSHNPDLIGGVRVRALDKQLDLSVETKLNRLKNSTVNAR